MSATVPVDRQVAVEERHAESGCLPPPGPDTRRARVERRATVTVARGKRGVGHDGGRRKTVGAITLPMDAAVAYFWAGANCAE